MTDTKARYLEMTDKMYYDEDGQPLHTDILGKDAIFRFRNGKLHSENGDAAIDCTDGHAEHWNNGKLHRAEGKPAVYTIMEDEHGNNRPYQEFWENGVRVPKPDT